MRGRSTAAAGVIIVVVRTGYGWGNPDRPKDYRMRPTQTCVPAVLCVLYVGVTL